MKDKFKNIWNVYANRKMAIMTALGFASGFPFLLVFSTLSLWLKESGWTYAAIGAFSLVKVPYAFKWLWSPLLDNLKIPFLWKLGRRRSWALLTQLILFVSIMAMSLVNPATQHNLMWLCAFWVCLASASLDIILDAYRVETFQQNAEEQAPGAAVFVLGYRLGLIFSGAGALWLAEVMSWNSVYQIMACGALVGIVTIILVKEPQTDFSYAPLKAQSWQDFLVNSVKEPLKDFTKHRHWLMILLFIFIYRMGDAYFAPMAFPFYDDMGFSKTEIAYVIKIYGMAATIAGGLFGGILIKKIGLFKGLYICGFIQGLTTLLFSIQAMVGHNLPLLTVIITLENFSSGMATTAFVAYISSLCNVLYTATQYALLSSLMSLARDVFAATSGLLAEILPWTWFFVVAAAFSIPGIFIIKWLAQKQIECKNSICKNAKKRLS